MTLTPEEKFNKDVWYVLQEIHKKSLYTVKGKSIDYWVQAGFFGAGVPSSSEEMAILEKLSEWGAIKIITQGWEYE